MGLKEKIRGVFPNAWHRLILIRRRLGIYQLYLRLFMRMCNPPYYSVWLSNRLQGKAVYFSPDKPYWRHIVNKACMFLGIAVTDDPERARIASFFWLPGTFTNGAPQKPSGFNSACLDISKTCVMKVFEEVFGYGYGVDARTHIGPCVKKSDENAAHDGALVEGPISNPDPAFVYQRLIDNRVSDDVTVDYRVSIVGGEIPFVLWKSRPIARRFMSDNIDVVLKLPGQLLSVDEQKKILLLCERMGLDMGELDVLRDKGDGRIYVVDVNRCPYGPAPDTPKHIGVLQVELTALALQRMFERTKSPKLVPSKKARPVRV